MIKMGSLAAKVFDFYDDPGFFEKQAAQTLVKKGRLISPDNIAGLPDQYFSAIIEGRTTTKRAYPIYNDASVALSMDYFVKSASMFGDTDRRDIRAKLIKAANQFKVDVPDDLLYPEEERDEAGENEKVLLASILDFRKQADFHTPQERMIAAKQIKQFADVTGQKLIDEEIESYIPKEAYGNKVDLGLSQRDQYIRRFDDEELKSTWEGIKKVAAHKDPNLLMEVLTIFDKHAGIDRMYDEIEDPVKTVYGVTKIAKNPKISPYVPAGAPSVAYTERSVKNYTDGPPPYTPVEDIPNQHESHIQPEKAVKNRLLFELTRVLNTEDFGSKELYYQFINDPTGFYQSCGKPFKEFLDGKLKNYITKYIMKNDYAGEKNKDAKYRFPVDKKGQR